MGSVALRLRKSGRSSLMGGLLSLGLVSAGMAACTAPPATVPSATSVQAAGAWRLSDRSMAAAADKRAVEAALEVMKAGGSAVDAAIAAHAVLGLVEPQSGLGGGGYMVVYDRKSNTTTVFDGRETAPAAATADYFTVDGQNSALCPRSFRASRLERRARLRSTRQLTTNTESGPGRRTSMPQSSSPTRASS